MGDQALSLIDDLVERIAARTAQIISMAEKAERPPMTPDDFFEKFGPRDRGLSRPARLAWVRGLRLRYPIIDERAGIGEGRLRRWHPDRLAEVFAELRPAMRRRREVEAVGE